MKTLYSSTFLSAILGFLMILGQSGKPIVIVSDQEKPVFTNIFKRELVPGSASDKIYVDVFNDLSCPGCKVFGRGILKELQKNYGNDPKVAFRLNLIGNPENADELLALKTIHCSANKEKFWETLWEMYNLEPMNQSKIEEWTQGKEWADEGFKACVTGDEMLPKIEAARQKMEQEKIDTLPSTLVGNVLLKGVHPIENIEREIRRQQLNLNPST